MKTVAWIVPKAGGMAGPTGFEPATSRLTIWRPNQAERRPHATQDGGRRIQIFRIKLSKYSSAYSCTSLLMDKAMPRAQFLVFLIGRRNRDRTCDLCLVRAALSQLSYPPDFSCSRQIFWMLSTPPSSVNQESCIVLARFSNHSFLGFIRAGHRLSLTARSNGTSSPVAWETRTVDFFQLCRIDVRINLRRRNVGVPQHRLHRSQVGAPL